jgi:hypothetical protein
MKFSFTFVKKLTFWFCGTTIQNISGGINNVTKGSKPKECINTQTQMWENESH